MPQILRRILDEHGADELGSFKAVLVGMLDTFAFERRIQETTAHLLQQDVFSSTAAYLHKKQRAFERPRAPPACALCGLALYPGDVRDAAAASVVFFRCAHAYHRRCCDRAACAICTARRASRLQSLHRSSTSSSQTLNQRRREQQSADSFAAVAGARGGGNINNISNISNISRTDADVVKEEEANPFGDSGRAAPAFRARQTAMEQRLAALDARVVRADVPFHGTSTVDVAPHRAHPLLAPDAQLPPEPVVCARLEGFSLSSAAHSTSDWS